MKKQKRILVLLVILLALYGFFYTLTYDLDGFNAKRDFIPVSVIVRGKDSMLYEAMRQGIEQAASDMRAEVSFVILSRENDVAEQTAMLERELLNGAKALIVSAADTERMTEAVDKAAERVPVIAIETPTLSENVKAYITADNYEMGRAIGREAAKRLFAGGRAVLLQSSAGCADIALREQGILDSFSDLGKEITVLPIDMNAELMPVQVATALAGAEIALAADTSLLEAAAQSLNLKGEEETPPCRLYGIGVTGKITSYLQKGVIHTVVAPNGFNIGYLSVKAAVDAATRKGVESNTEIEYMVVNGENMYSVKGQRLIFPFSK